MAIGPIWIIYICFVVNKVSVQQKKKKKMLNFSRLNAINAKKHTPSMLLNPINFAIQL